MKQGTLVATVGIAGIIAGTAAAGDLWDNGPPDGRGGHSNATAGVFGARRTLLDDFVVPTGDSWRITDFHWQHVWDTLPAGSGTGLELLFRSDAGGAPGTPITGLANVTSYSEMGSGVTYFGRPGSESWATFDAITLGAGTYWFEATIVGPENNFWLTRQEVTGSQHWVNYEDFNGLEPGVNIFRIETDLNFVITGEVVPVPGALALLGLAGLAGTRRRHV